MKRRAVAGGLGGAGLGPGAHLPDAFSNQLTDVLAAVSEINGQLLDALAHSAQSKFPFPLSGSLRAAFAALSSNQRRIGGHCGVLLADAGFSDLARWQDLVTHGELAQDCADSDWLPREDAVVLASALYMVAWHVVHVRPSVAGVLMGMPEPVVAMYRRLGVADLARIARRHPQWIRPRWSNRPDLWQSIVDGAEQPSSYDPASVILRCLKASATGSTRLLSFLGNAI